MVTKNEIKFINSLKKKKFRDLNNSFVVEGKKSISEFINSNYDVIKLYSIDKSFFKNIENHFQIDFKLLKKISSLINPDDHLAIFKKRETKSLDYNSLIIAFESIRDPGNLGTIIRTCEWFGVKQIVCSKDSVDLYNPKVIQASMGSSSRININYLDLKPFLQASKLQTFGTALKGESIYGLKSKINSGILIFGNEANGISKELLEIIDKKFSIPRPKNQLFPESLNLASSLAIFLSEIKGKFS
jgi:TrmH family RNA methyltransferase